MTKKFFALLLAGIMVFGITAFAEGEEEAQKLISPAPLSISLTIGEKTLSVGGGIDIELDVAPCIVNDRTMVPMRAIFEALGATVEWDQETRTVLGVNSDVTVVMQIGQSYMFVANSEGTTRIELDSPSIIIDDRTMVPLRAIAEAYGNNVGYDEATQTITITR